MIARWLAILTIVILLLAFAWHADPLAPSPPAITLSLSHSVSPQPASFRARVQIQPHPDNRWWCVVFDGPEYKRSCRELEGVGSPRTFTVWFNNLSGGEYAAVAELYRVTEGEPKTIRSALVRFQVIGLF